MKHRDVAVILATGGHGAGARRLQRRQAGLRRGAGQRARATSSAAQTSPKRRARHRARQDVRQRRAVLVAQLGGRGRSRRRGGAPPVPVAEGAHFLNARRRWTRWPRASSPRSASQPGARRQDAPRSSPRRSASRSRTAPERSIAPLDGVGRDYPLSIEKLCPVLSWYVVQDWREGCERCIEILRYGGMGHTMSIHSQNDDVILQFGLKKPAFRIVREHADHARVDRADHRSRSGDDARLRRLGRQHHLRQHLAAASAEPEARGLRYPAG